MSEISPERQEEPGQPLDARETLIHNEQTKLTANIINGVGLAFIVGGGVTTMTGLGTVSSAGDPLLRASIWILAGVVLHLSARMYLRTLR